MPKLRIVRFNSTLPAIDITEIPTSLDEVSLRGLSVRVDGSARAKHLLLAGTRVPDVDALWRTEGVEQLTVAMPVLPPWIRASPSVSSLHIECNGRDEDIEAMLASCGDALERVTLRHERVSDRILETLARFPKLRFVDVVDTCVTKEALRAFLEKRPGVRSLPKLE